MAGKRGLIFGVGVNDANYKVHEHGYVNDETGKNKRIKTWCCPFYTKWVSMLRRCYSQVFVKANPHYAGCSVVSDWHVFSNFKAWMEKQDWEGKHLDKDLLVRGNRVYGPDTCVFVSKDVNAFITEHNAGRGDWPIGVCFINKNKKFKATCNESITNRCVHLGYFTTPEEAHLKWLAFKLKQAKILASLQTDTRISEALIERYENYDK